MADTTTITQTSKKVEGNAKILADVILASRTFAYFSQFDGGVIPAVRDTFRMWTGVVGEDFVQDYADTPSQDGALTITDAEFTLSKKSVSKDIAFDSFKNTIFNLSISDLKSQELPEEVQEFISRQIGLIAAKIAGNNIWNGNGAQTGDPTDMNGFAILIKNAVPAGQETTSAALDPTVTADVDDVLAALVALATDEMVASKDKFKIYMNEKVNDAYYAHLAAQAATNIPQNSALKYYKWDIEIIPELSDRRLIIANPENMALGLGVTGELTELDYVNMYPLGQGNKVRVVGNWGYGAGIAGTDFCIFEYTA